MPLLDKNRSFLDNVSDVTEKHKKLITLAIVLKWMTKNKWIVFFILLSIVMLIEAIITGVLNIFA
ncbi:MAG: hypothetical protein E7138_01745 [Rikenellaceae bacterium]|nr:hypothetical protein [Rikenellaceae bacterium]